MTANGWWALGIGFVLFLAAFAVILKYKPPFGGWKEE